MVMESESGGVEAGLQKKFLFEGKGVEQRWWGRGLTGRCVKRLDQQRSGFGPEGFSYNFCAVCFGLRQSEGEKEKGVALPSAGEEGLHWACRMKRKSEPGEKGRGGRRGV